jgi:FG-GAP repeat
VTIGALIDISTPRARLGAASVAAAAAVLALTGFTATSPLIGPEQAADQATEFMPSSTSLVPRHSAAGGAAVLPLAAQSPVSATLGRHDQAYWIKAGRAANRAQRLTASFASSGATVATGSAHVQLRLSSYGRASALRALAPANPTAMRNRVVYRLGSVDEWYANGPLGLEQGFDVDARPTTGTGPLMLSLSLRSNLRVRSAGTGILLIGGGVRLRYAGLSARDALGRPLRAWLTHAQGRITIAVEDHRATYPLHIDPIIQQAELTAADGVDNDVLGATLAMDGDTIVAAAPGKTVGANPGQGALYVFVKPSSGWADAHQDAELTSSDGAALGDVAISGDTIVAGAPGKQLGDNQDQGAAYVFVRPPGGWHDGTQTAVLTASNGAAEDRLGSGVAISGDTIVAGAPGRKSNQGAGYVFVKPTSGWADGTQTAMLTALGGAPQDALGLLNSVAISGDTIVLGGSNHQVGDHQNQGLAYVYVKPDGGWSDTTQTATLASTDGGAGDLFGFAVAVSSDTVVVGAPHHSVGRQAPGVAYVFTEPPFGWAQRPDETETAQLRPSDGATDDRFGAQVDISGTTVFAGSFLHQVGPNPAQGALYFFNRPGFVWSDETENGQLTAADGGAREGFADTVAASGNLVAAGEPAHTVGQHFAQGAVYLFGVPPAITIATPANGATYTRGQTVLASYVCAAPSGTVLASCRGTVAAGSAIDTNAPGPHSFTVRAVDTDGTSAAQMTTYTVATPATTTPGTKARDAPSIMGLHQSVTRWRTGTTRTHRRHPPIGTVFSFTLDQPATVTLRFTRETVGRRVGGQCVTSMARNRHRRRCTREIAAGALKLAARKGVNEIHFRGRVTSGRILPPGHYAMTTTATNAAHQHTTLRPLHFTIER